MSEKFIVHYSGPDDIFEAATWLDACELASGLNEVSLEYLRRTTSEAPIRSWATPYTLADAVARGVISDTGGWS